METEVHGQTHRVSRSICFLGTIATRANAEAAPITLNLDCVLNFNPCQPSATFGTITLDQVGSGISVTVDLAGTEQKFRDLVLNYGGSATTITDNDPNNTVSLTPDGFQIIRTTDSLISAAAGARAGTVRTSIPRYSPVTSRC